MNKKQAAVLEVAYAAQIELAKRRCLTSTLFNAQYFFEKIKKETFIVNDHHKIICDALDKVYAGEITRLIINIAPRYTKTELAVKTFIAKGLAHNPKAKFIHLSYSDSLALDNSDSIRNVCKDPIYQKLFPHVQISTKSDSKKKWYTIENGGVYATASAGQVTGFGAGAVDGADKDRQVSEEMQLFQEITEQVQQLDEAYEAGQQNDGRWKNPYPGFAGAIIIDDPIKPEDAHSPTVRNKINSRFDSTIRNRVNSQKTPIIICHQRVHEEDLTGHLMKLEPEKWTVIKLPCLKPDNTPLWDLKHNYEELQHLKRINLYVFESQYQQDPKPVKRGGEFYKLFSMKNVIKNPRAANGYPSLYDPNAPIHITYDWNAHPYLAIGIWQLKGKKAYKIDEIDGRSPNNKAKGASRLFMRKYPGHKAGLFVHGDPSGIKEDTRLEKGQNDFTIVMNELKEYHPTLRKLDSAPSVSMRGNFINTIFEAGFEGVELFIGDNCTLSIADFQFTKEDSDGTKLKEMFDDPISGIRCQKYGHLSDADDYFVCRTFAAEYTRYQKGPGTGRISTGKNSSKSSY